MRRKGEFVREKFQPEGVPRSSVAINTIDRILELADSRPLVYLPTHDPESVGRLTEKCTLGESPMRRHYEEELVLEFENIILIDRPTDEVFAFLSDFENIPKWNYYVLEVGRLSESPIGIWTTYHQVRKTDQQEFRIIEFEPNHSVAVKTLPQSSPSFERRFTLYEEGDTTRIRDQWKLDTGRPTVLERLARGRVKSAAGENLAKLKELLEEGRVILQDDRQVTL